MRILSYSFETQLSFSGPVTNHDFILRCAPKSTPFQKVLDSQMIMIPGTHLMEQQDGFGNRLHVGSIPEAHDSFSFTSYGLVMVDQEAECAEAPHPMYLRPSSFTQPSHEAVVFASRALQTIPNAHVWKRAVELMHAVYRHFTYDPMATTTATTAAQAFGMAAGVCQDYAHSLIMMCRAKGIPARYCAGLMEGEGATHAWVEVHDGRNWRGLDPTNDRVVDEAYIVFSHGRDFEDCSIERGVFSGAVDQSQHVKASVSKDGGATRFAEFAEAAQQ